MAESASPPCYTDPADETFWLDSTRWQLDNPELLGPGQAIICKDSAAADQPWVVVSIRRSDEEDCAEFIVRHQGWHRSYVARGPHYVERTEKWQRRW